MVRLGKVYENMMVDLQLTNQKLTERAKRIIMMATGCTYEEAAEILKSAGNHVKTAIVMKKLGVSANDAKKKLEEANGFVKKAIIMK
jgi:N-acetylmuramic acid 6-phosphate etherase